MPSSIIGALRVTLGLDSAQFEAGASRAEKRAEQIGYRIGRSLRAPIDAAVSLRGALVALGGGAIVAAAQKALDYASSLGEVAQQLGVTTKDLQEYRYAASQAGISQEEMDKALSKLTLTMGKARDGAQGPKQAFTELSGILGRDILRSAQTAGDAIPLIADALAKVEDPSKRARLEMELFGRTGQRLDTLLAGGSASINQLRDAAQDLGIVLSEEQIANADRTADKLTELKMVLEANIAGAVANNVNSIYEFVDSLTALIAKVPAAIRALENFRARLVQAETIGAQFSPFAPNQKKIEARSANAQARITLATNRIRDRLDTLPANQRLGALKRWGATDDQIRALGFDPSPAAPAARGGAGAGTSDAEAAAASRKAAQAQRERERQAEEAARRERQYQEELSRSQVGYLQAQQDLTVDQVERAALEREISWKEHQQRLQSIDTDKDLTQAQKARLTAIENETQALRDDLINRRENEELARQAYEIASAQNANEQDLLRARAELARTAKERRDLELKMLDLQFQQLNAEQDRIINSRDSSAVEIEIAKERKKTLAQLQGLAAASVERQNQGPLGQYLDSIPRTADEINEALEGVRTDGIRGLIDGLAEAAAGTRSLGDVFKNVSQQIIADLARIALQKAITGALGNALGGLFGGGGGGGSLSGLLGGSAPSSLFDGGLDLGGLIEFDPFKSFGGFRAGGGSVSVGKTYMVGERGPELFSPASSGSIISNDNLGRGPIELKVYADEGAMFVPRVEAISSDVSVRHLDKVGKAQSNIGRRRIGR
ncbi:hypothetical protein LZK98_11565 [Sphingomonas cannabina]|uniref:hypothetical protein n=1 Tax=Sphingomonas cannabina TaxID=2899123 RepID=UPI001F44FD96|nr:hypothetical protein [Sphingomonas cannabina]UIJ43728.1 hypothetical protein LZK98_11565 [Sphingomonas cannabina]